MTRPDRADGAVALVLSGGGARGAYEAGVLDVVLGEIGGGAPGRFDFVCGTSVGAVNGTFLTSVAHDPGPGLKRLVDEWTGLVPNRVLGFGWREVKGLRRLWRGGGGPASLFDGRRLAALVRHRIDWRRLRQNLAQGVVEALTVTATHVATGRSVVFVDRAAGAPLPRPLPPGVRLVERRVDAAEVLASAAIPLVFPPVEVEGALYLDGGLRLNTPITPALRLGATRLLVIGLEPLQEPPRQALEPDENPGAAFLFGKVLDTFLGDQIQEDLHDLARRNRLLRDIEEVAGSEVLDGLGRLAASRGDEPPRVVHPLVIRPSVDIGEIANARLHATRPRFGPSVGHWLVQLLDLAEGSDADLASYLLFDGAFARDLVELGRSDARARRDEIAAFLHEQPA